MSLDLQLSNYIAIAECVLARKNIKQLSNLSGLFLQCFISVLIICHSSVQDYSLFSSLIYNLSLLFNPKCKPILLAQKHNVRLCRARPIWNFWNQIPLLILGGKNSLIDHLYGGRHSEFLAEMKINLFCVNCWLILHQNDHAKVLRRLLSEEYLTILYIINPF